MLKYLCMGLNSSHFDWLRIRPFGLPSVPRTSKALRTAEPGPARAPSSRYNYYIMIIIII